MIKFGVCQWIMDRRGVDSLPRAAELGFAGIQLGIAEDDLEIRGPALQRAYLQAAEETGVEIVGFGINTMNVLPLYSPPDSEKGRRCRDLLRSTLDTALAMGVGLVYCPSFFEAEISDDDQLERAGAMLRQGCEYIEDQPVLLASENTLDVARTRRLVEQVDHPSLRVLVDSYNPVLFGHLASDLVRELPTPLLGNQAHAKDGQNQVMGNAPLGSGEGHFREFVQALRDVAFEGWLISETDYRNNADALAAADLATLRALAN
ncbi:MAG: sugar phosphate isomerase/epimerase [Anaerolineaceae bacterium]|nr:sugar phosphate isomerase/epimerase [Anaerolineaceae bacterium]